MTGGKGKGKQPHKVRPAELGSLLGIEGVTPGRFTLWHRCVNGHRPKQAWGEAGQDAKLHIALRDYVMATGVLGAQACVPKQVRSHDALPLEGIADIGFRPGARFGDGTGVGIVEAVDPGAWRTLWRDDEGVPRPPPAVRARMEGIFMLYPECTWGVVIVQLGWRRPLEPLRCEPEERLGDALGTALAEFGERIESGDAPDPDGRADRDCLTALAAQSAAGESRDLKEVEGESATTLEEAVRQAQSLRDGIEQWREQGRAKEAEYHRAVGRVVKLVGNGKAAQTANMQVRLNVETRPTRPPDTLRTTLDVAMEGRVERLEVGASRRVR